MKVHKLRKKRGKKKKRKQPPVKVELVLVETLI